MPELLSQFQLHEIVLFIVLLAAALKGVWSFIEWLISKFNKGYTSKKKKESQDKQIEDLATAVAGMQKSIQLLLDSDRDDIKAWITKEHHYYCYVKGYIDDFSLDCIEKRYSHYKDEGGNSFIASLMAEIRALPHK